MISTRTVTASGGLLGVFLLAAGCALSAPEQESVGTTSDAVVGVDTYLYFRSNASGWDADTATRFRPTIDPAVYKVTYPVTEEWMVTGGDNAIFTETDQLNGWGTVQDFFGSSVDPVIVPGGGAASGINGFLVQYPSLGRYQVAYDIQQDTFQIQQAPPARQWEPNPRDTAAITTIAVAPWNAEQMVVGYTNGDVFLTFQGSSPTPSWTKIDTINTYGGLINVLPNIPVTSIAIGPGDGKSIFVAFAGAQQGHKLWATGNGGQSWGELSSVPIVPIVNVSVNPIQGSRVYVLAEGGAVAVSDDYGSTWTTDPTSSTDSLQPPISAGGRISTVSASQPSTPDQIWVGATTGEIFVTFDATSGQHWTRVNAANMPARVVSRVTVNSRLQPPELWATFEGLNADSIWHSVTGGQFWQNMHNPNLPTTPIPVINLAIYGASVNPVDNNVVYANDSYGAANRTEDRGLSWLHITN